MEELTPTPLSIGEIQKVLAKLLRENVSIRNLPMIFETLADYSKLTSDPDILTEYVRQPLHVKLQHNMLQDGSNLKVITVPAKLEKIIADSIQQTEHGNYLAMDPQDSQNVLESIAKEVERVSLYGTITNYFMFTSNSDVFKTINGTLFPANSYFVL